jgi:hypothetical protein
MKPDPFEWHSGRTPPPHIELPEIGSVVLVSDDTGYSFEAKFIGITNAMGWRCPVFVSTKTGVAYHRATKWCALPQTKLRERSNG